MKSECQQFQLYAAEGSGAEDFITPGALQLYVDELRERPYWERNFPQVLRIEAFVDGRRKSSVGIWDSEKGCGLIDMAPEHLSEQLILHEVAHVLAEARYGSGSHDPWFARTYLELVYEVLGPDRYFDLAASFDAHNVDYNTDSAVPGGIAL
jgi:putative metallohydrolase (TIGR04338 family)